MEDFNFDNYDLGDISSLGVGSKRAAEDAGEEPDAKRGCSSMEDVDVEMSVSLKLIKSALSMCAPKGKNVELVVTANRVQMSVYNTASRCDMTLSDADSFDVVRGGHTLYFNAERFKTSLDVMDGDRVTLKRVNMDTLHIVGSTVQDQITLNAVDETLDGLPRPDLYDADVEYKFARSLLVGTFKKLMKFVTISFEQGRMMLSTKDDHTTRTLWINDDTIEATEETLKFQVANLAGFSSATGTVVRMAFTYENEEEETEGRVTLIIPLDGNENGGNEMRITSVLAN